jgi:hypothetical protein
MSQFEEDKDDEKRDESLDNAEEGEGANPWAKTSSGDEDDVVQDDD